MLLVFLLVFTPWNLEDSLFPSLYCERGERKGALFCEGPEAPKSGLGCSPAPGLWSSFEMSKGISQCCVLAPTLFSIYSSLLLKATFGDTMEGGFLHTRRVVQHRPFIPSQRRRPVCRHFALSSAASSLAMRGSTVSSSKYHNNVLSLNTL